MRGSRLARFGAVLMLLVGLAACAHTPEEVAASKPVAALNVDDGVALHGYDPVAYFTDNKPIKGSKDFAYRWQGAEWRFASAAHRDSFAAAPEKYAPQYGGYCAYAVSQGGTADIDPDEFAVVNDKLYLNNNFIAQSLWDQDRKGHIVKGDGNWQIQPKTDLAVK